MFPSQTGKGDHSDRRIASIAQGAASRKGFRDPRFLRHFDSSKEGRVCPLWSIAPLGERSETLPVSRPSLHLSEK